MRAAAVQSVLIFLHKRAVLVHGQQPAHVVVGIGIGNSTAVHGLGLAQYPAVLIPGHRPARDRLRIDRGVFRSQLAIAVEAAAAVQGIAADLLRQAVGRISAHAVGADIDQQAVVIITEVFRAACVSDGGQIEVVVIGERQRLIERAIFRLRGQQAAVIIVSKRFRPLADRTDLGAAKVRIGYLEKYLFCQNRYRIIRQLQRTNCQKHQFFEVPINQNKIWG
jgi:hypothetical protein